MDSTARNGASKLTAMPTQPVRGHCVRKRKVADDCIDSDDMGTSVKGILRSRAEQSCAGWRARHTIARSDVRPALPARQMRAINPLQSGLHILIRGTPCQM